MDEDMDLDLMPGVIIKIRLKNFVNYNKITFYPKPGLNILMGPNGSGKSSLVSAIVLGLGGKTSMIGRSNDINDFIMSGEENAQIELELYNSTGDNYFIKRKFTRGSHSVWYINNKKVNAKQVESLIKELNIQVDNLCQFLPQDRVQDFAKMSSVQLFENTLKTIGFGNLPEKFSTLKEMRETQITLRQKLETKQKLHQEEVLKIQRLEKDVQSILERKNVLTSITFCKQKIAWFYHNERKEELTKVKGYLQDSMNALENFEKELAPLKNSIKQFDKEKMSKEKLAQTKEMHLNKTKDNIYKLNQEADITETKISNVEKELEEKLEAERLNLSKVTAIDVRIMNLKEQYGESKECDLLKVTRESDKVINSSMAAIMKLREKEYKYMEEISAANNILRAKEHELTQAASVEKKKFDLLSDGHVLTAYKWLQTNRDKISAPVYGPLFMELNIKDPQGAKYVEAAIPFKDLVAFFAETPQATTELFKKLRDEQSLKINGACAEHPERSISSLYPSNINISFLRQFGFKCYLIDLVEGPLPLLSYLCKNFSFHNIPVSFQPIEDADAVPKSIKVFFAGDVMYSVRVSKYSKEVSSIIKNIGKERFFGVSVNKALINELKKQVNLKKNLLSEYQQALHEAKEETRTVEEVLREERNKKKEANYKLETLRAISVKLRRLEEEKKALMTFSVDKKAETLAAKSKIKQILEENAGNQFVLVNLLEEFNCLYADVYLAELEAEAARIKKESAVRELETSSDRKKELKSKCEELQRAVNELNTEVRELSSQAKKLTNNLSFDDPEFKKKFSKEFSKLPETIDEIKAKIYKFEARAKCLHNPLEDRMLKDYQESTETSKVLEIELRKLEDQLVTCETDLAKLKEEWLSQVDELVKRINSKFSAFFAAMKCAGEVKVNKGNNEEEIEKYGLEILVKFRDDHGLRVLDGFTQSGGERALTTAVFLLSLQGISVAPFRCIDEINQGMDEYNERRVYNLLFNTVSQDGSQYFLLTPKLLDYIDYPDNCHIHCISNTLAVQFLQASEN